MEIIIHVEKRKLDHDYEQAIAEYAKRLSPFCRLKLVTYKSFAKLATQAGSAVFCVRPGNVTLSSEGLAELIEQKALSGYSRLEFIVEAEPDRFEQEEVAEAADTFQKPFSVSSFAMSCDLTAVVLSEQLYRSYTILNHITYHK